VVVSQSHFAPVNEEEQEGGQATTQTPGAAMHVLDSSKYLNPKR
jgi:hypothetical protein